MLQSQRLVTPGPVIAARAAILAGLIVFMVMLEAVLPCLLEFFYPVALEQKAL